MKAGLRHPFTVESTSPGGSRQIMHGKYSSANSGKKILLISKVWDVM